MDFSLQAQCPGSFNHISVWFEASFPLDLIDQSVCEGRRSEWHMVLEVG